MDDYGLTALMAVLEEQDQDCKNLIDVGADHAIDEPDIPLIDSVKNDAMKNILVQSPLIAEYDRVHMAEILQYVSEVDSDRIMK